MAVANRKRVFATTAVLLIALAAVGVWHFVVRDEGALSIVIRDSGPPAVTIESALEALALSDIEKPAADVSDLTGTWALVQSPESFAGYRVTETLVSVGVNAAVGRTTEIEGTLTFDGSAIRSVDMAADLRALTSDKAARDAALHDQAIESDRYPDAVFTLTGPIPVRGVPEDGEVVSERVLGELLLHGVSRVLPFEVEAALQDGLLVVVGMARIDFADFDIERPKASSVLSSEDHGTLEFQLVFMPEADQ